MNNLGSTRCLVILHFIRSWIFTWFQKFPLYKRINFSLLMCFVCYSSLACLFLFLFFFCRCSPSFSERNRDSRIGNFFIDTWSLVNLLCSAIACFHSKYVTESEQSTLASFRYSCLWSFCGHKLPTINCFF